MAKIYDEVNGRSGYLYPAKHLSGNLYIVGKYIVLVEENAVQETICKATKKNKEAIMTRERIVG